MFTFNTSLIFVYEGNPSCGVDKDYNEDCCTTSNQCGIGQGGCTSDDQCGANANLECTDCTVHNNFPDNAKCCQIIGLLSKILLGTK